MRLRNSSIPAALAAVSVVALFFAAAATEVGAQGAAALVTGTVQDETGAVLPGATVTATNQESGVQRITVTDELGRYRLPALIPGVYQFTGQISGFETLTMTDITLQIGQEASLDFTLGVRSIEEAVTVTGASPLIETTKSEIAQAVTDLQIQTLPVNTREWINLAMLAAGVSQDNIRGYYNNANIGGGSRWYSNAFVVDGVRNTWAEQGEPRQNFPMDSIAEFRVTQSLYKAEEGLASGGLLTAVTKSGTNTLTGSTFLYLRDKALNALGEFEDEKPAFKRYQFGGSLGGPIVEDRTHFFFSYERTELDHFFTVNTGGALPAEEGTFPRDDYRQMYVLRFDHLFNPYHSMMVRYAQEDERQEDIGAGGTRLKGSGFTQHIPRRAVVGTYSWIPNNDALNEFRVQWAFAAYQIWPGSSSENFTENGIWSEARFNALDQVIIRPSSRRGFSWADVGPEVRLQLRDDFSYFVTGPGGEHAIKMGVDYSWVDFSDDWSGNPRGTFRFPTDEPYDPDNPDTHPTLFTASGPFALLRAFQYGGFPAEWNTNVKSAYYSAYIQDDWKPNDRMTLNLGLRYDLQTGVFNKDLDSSISPFIDAAARGDNNNFGPRFGFAYDLTGDGRSVMRGGYGLYYDNIRTLPQFGERRNFQYINLQIRNPGYPNPFGGRDFLEFASTAAPGITITDNGYVNPYSHQANVSFTRQISSDLAMSVDFNYTKGNAYRSVRDIDIFPGPGLPRPNPEYARITEVGNLGATEYKAMFIRLDKRFADDWQLMASYTLSKSDDYPDGFPQDHTNVDNDWGPDSTDRRHRAVISGIWMLPYGIELSGIADIRSARPVNVTAGTDLNGDAISGDRPPGVTRNQGCRDLDFGAVNAYRQSIGLSAVNEGAFECPNYFNVDFRLSKRFSIGGPRDLELFVQAFNLLNRAHFAIPVGNVRSGAFGTSVSAGFPRQVELAARIHF